MKLLLTKVALLDHSVSHHSCHVTNPPPPPPPGFISQPPLLKIRSRGYATCPPGFMSAHPLKHFWLRPWYKGPLTRHRNNITGIIWYHSCHTGTILFESLSEHFFSSIFNRSTLINNKPLSCIGVNTNISIDYPYSYRSGPSNFGTRSCSLHIVLSIHSIHCSSIIEYCVSML